MLFGHMRRDAPANYCKPTLQQVLRADRAVFAKLIQEDVLVRRDAANNQPVSDALVPALNSYDVGFRLIPLPKPPPRLVLLNQNQQDKASHRTLRTGTRHIRQEQAKERPRTRAREGEQPTSSPKRCKDVTMCPQTSTIAGCVLVTIFNIALMQRLVRSVATDGICAAEEIARLHMSMMPKRAPKTDKRIGYRKFNREASKRPS